MLDTPPSQNIHTFLLLRLIGEWLEIITLNEQIRAAMLHANVNVTELAKQFGTSQSSMTQRLKKGKFTKEELKRIADILGCEYISIFKFPDGREY